MAENKHANCEFCSFDRMNGSIFPDYMQISETGCLKHELIYDGKYFVVKPDISPIVKGHLLIIPKKHYYSILSIPSEQLEEIYMLKQKIIDYYASQDKHFMFFEHGCCSEAETGSSCIHHAHLHAIPIDEKNERQILTNVVSELGFNTKKPHDLENSVYLYMQTTFSPALFWEDEKLHSQFFRIKLADIFGYIQRARWQNCIVNEKERLVSECWLNSIKNLKF